MSNALYTPRPSFPGSDLSPASPRPPASAHPSCPTASCTCSCWEAWRNSWKPELSPGQVDEKDAGWAFSLCQVLGCAGHQAWWVLNLWTKGSCHPLLTDAFYILNLLEILEV